MSTIKDLYNSVLPAGGFIPADSKRTPYQDFACYALAPDKGHGYFWVYFFKDMFEITIQDFVFSDDYVLECPETEFLSVLYYISVSGEELHPYHQLSPNRLNVKIGKDNAIYQAIYHKNVPLQSVAFSINPEFYRQYLQQKFPGEYIDPSEAFKQMENGNDFPELVALLIQIRNYRGSGISAKMFYEGKILEAISLIMERAKQNHAKKNKLHLSDEEIDNLTAVAAYLDNHFSFSTIPMDRLCQIAFMGQTKLKVSFKEYFGCTIFDYILQRRIEHAQHLLIGTDLSISEIAQAVGYIRSDSFSKQFHKVTGLLPREYRARR